MASLVMVKNPLTPFERETYSLAEGERPIDWLGVHYPEGCGGALRYFVNGRERDLDDLDYMPAPDDVVVLAVHPAGLEAFWIPLLVGIALSALSYGLTALLTPKPQAPPFTQADNSEPSPVYSVRSSQNVARLAEPVPVPYGNVLHTPDLISQPYYFFSDERDQWLDMVLCLGVGDVTVQQVLIGDSDADTIEGLAVQWQVVPPSMHGNQIGSMRDLFGAPATNPNFYENMLSSVEVGEQEFVHENDEAGWFRMGKAGQTGRFLWVDIFWPAGLYQLDNWNSAVVTQCAFTVMLQQADANGQPIAGTDQAFTFNQATGIGHRDPLRVSYFMDTGVVAMWLVKLHRITEQYPNGNEQNAFTWTGLRMQVHIPASHFVYGNTTLLAVRFRATSINSAANNQVRVRLQRNLPSSGSGAAVATNSPADAFADILTNTDYGARRPLSEVDTARLDALKTFWALGGHDYGFNAIYTGKTTVWEALTDCLAVVAATPLPLGNLMSIAQDGIKDVRTVLFSEQNIAKDSFALSYSFDREGEHDGIEVEYRNPGTFAPAFARYPATSQDPDKLELFGCTDSRQAGEFAVLSWNRRTFNRRVVTLNTELEGLIPILGERAAVAHTLPRWGQSGFVMAVDGLTITLDRDLMWDAPELVPPFVMTFRDQYGGVSNVVEVTQGAAPNIAVLAADPWASTGGDDWSLDLSQELTHFAFGDATRAVKDFILTTLAPSDGQQVKVTGIYYDPAVYVASFAFLAFPVP